MSQQSNDPVEEYVPTYVCAHGSMVLTVTRKPHGVRCYDAHWPNAFADGENDYRYPVNYTSFATPAEAMAWVDGYEQGARENQ